MFRYKTRGNSSPQGKQRVYFTCHPEDFGQYFEKTADAILEVADCAIWYLEGDANGIDQGAYEDIETDLGQMALFVIPVTAKLLTTENRTVDVDLPFALSHRVPVLPLLQEKGLDEPYAKIFGNLQYLAPVVMDDTALRYEDKFKKFLESVLIGDDMAEMIRKAFDAYVFMSYRKKDRKYANELMRLIHENEFCRDVAIWYDEYLTPGENFNDGIVDALNKSEMVALVVTPNLVNEDNYVQSTEYPMAKDAGKSILPATMVETDDNLLVKQYSEIPERIDAYDGKALSDGLRKQLAGIVKPENDNDPEHNYLIGLAYLNGVDVEKNAVRAVQLITMAAEAGYATAMYKLVYMYTYGQGTEQDERKAIYWQKRCVDYVLGLEDREKYQPVLALFYSDLMVAHVKLLEYEEAEGYGLKALEIREKIQDESISYKADLASSYNNMAVLYGHMKRDGLEAEYHVKALRIRQELCKKDASYEDDLAYSYFNLASMLRANGYPEEAENYNKLALEIWERLSALEPEKHLRNVASCHFNLGNLFEENMEFTKATQCYAKAVQILEGLCRDGLGAYGEELMKAYLNMGTVCLEDERNEEAEKYWKKALQVANRLVKINPGPYEENLAKIYFNLAVVYEELERLEQAEDCSLKALEIRERLREKNPEAYELYLARSYESLGRICEKMQKGAEEERYLLKALPIWEKLGETNKVIREEWLAECCRMLWQLYDAQGRLKEAEKFAIKYLEARGRSV